MDLLFGYKESSLVLLIRLHFGISNLNWRKSQLMDDVSSFVIEGCSLFLVRAYAIWFKICMFVFICRPRFHQAN